MNFTLAVTVTLEAGVTLRALLGDLVALDRAPPRGSVEFAVTPVVSDVSSDKATASDAAAPKPRGRPKKDAEPVAPPAPEPEVKAQDAADEAAESAAAAPAEAGPAAEVFTHDTVRAALGEYAKAWTMEAAMEDGPQLIGAKKVSEVPDTQEALGKAVAALRDAVTANPFKREKAA